MTKLPKLVFLKNFQNIVFLSIFSFKFNQAALSKRFFRKENLH